MIATDDVVDDTGRDNDDNDNDDAGNDASSTDKGDNCNCDNGKDACSSRRRRRHWQRVLSCGRGQGNTYFLLLFVVNNRGCTHKKLH